MEKGTDSQKGSRAFERLRLSVVAGTGVNGEIGLFHVNRERVIFHGLQEKKAPGEPDAFSLGLQQSYALKWRKTQKRPPESRAAAGRVKTQAMAMERSVDHWSPLPLATMVPAMPELSTCVVLTGRPNWSARMIVADATNSADAPCA